MNKNTFHILVVDDDDRIRSLVKEYLIKNNFLVTTAKDALDAKKKIEILKFDILILDIMMPGESGLSLTKEIKKNDMTPIILLTAKDEVNNRIEGSDVPAADVVSARALTNLIGLLKYAYPHMKAGGVCLFLKG